MDRYLLGVLERANRRITEASSSRWMAWLGLGGVCGIVNVYDWAGRGGLALTDAWMSSWRPKSVFHLPPSSLVLARLVMSVLFVVGAFVACMVPETPPKHAVTSSLERQPLFLNARPWRSDTAGRPDLGVVLLILCSPSTQEGGDTRRSCQIVSRKKEGCIFPDSNQRSVSRSSSCVASGQGLRLHPTGTGGEDR